MIRSVLLLLLAPVLALAAAPAGSPAPDKRAYSWANPTPEAQLREMSTDRPDATEGPSTVDAGHVQFEFDFASYTRDRTGGVRATELALMPVNLRVGLTHNFELGLFLAPYVRQTEQLPRTASSAVSGLGDTGLRAKLNFWGNDGGESAAGIIIDLKLPTAARGLGNDKVEGAVTLPISFELAGGFELGANTSVGLAHDGSSYRGVWVNTATLGHDLAENFGGYVELTSAAGEGPHVCTLNVGATYKLGRHAQFDAGVNFGVSRAAPDVQLFAGFTRRF